MLCQCPLPPTSLSWSCLCGADNISDTVGAGATDGVHVCQHGSNHGSAPDALGCRNLSWGIYLDGGDSQGSGYCGARIEGNVISSSMSGALFINGGGNVNFS